jgi:hypothetical protein
LLRVVAKSAADYQGFFFSSQSLVDSISRIQSGLRSLRDQPTARRSCLLPLLDTAVQTIRWDRPSR